MGEHFVGVRDEIAQQFELLRGEPRLATLPETWRVSKSISTDLERDAAGRALRRGRPPKRRTDPRGQLSRS